MIKTFRGLMGNDTQDTIVLHTNDGSTGYRIVKLEIMPKQSQIDYEITFKIYKVSQGSPPTVDNNVDMSDSTLLGAAFSGLAGGEYAGAKTIIFDNEIFNQDIFVTSTDNGGSAQSVNYYLELEQINLDLSESTVATLKDIRNARTTIPTS